MREEVERALRVSDMLTSCHSALRDRYARRALILDLAILIFSAWLVAMAFVDPEIAKHFSFPGISPTTTIGLLAVGTFVLSLLQLRTDWKYRAERFDQAAKAYALMKLALGATLASETLDQEQARRALEGYRNIGERVVSVPENQFNKLRKRHLMKMKIAQTLDKYGATNIFLVRIRLWFSDTRKLFSE